MILVRCNLILSYLIPVQTSNLCIHENLVCLKLLLFSRLAKSDILLSMNNETNFHIVRITENRTVRLDGSDQASLDSVVLSAQKVMVEPTNFFDVPLMARSSLLEELEEW